jgi:predicted lipid-binding transport protein (Tim44 family)
MPLIDAQRTRDAAAALKARDAAFDEQHFYTRLTGAFMKIQSAWCDQDLAPARAFISDGVYERFSLQIQEQRDLGWRDRMEQIKVQGVRLAQVSSGEVFTAATVRIAASAVNDRVSLADGSRLPGSRAPESFVEFWTWLRRSDAQTVLRDGLIEGRCPNCGAAL